MCVCVRQEVSECVCERQGLSGSGRESWREADRDFGRKKRGKQQASFLNIFNWTVPSGRDTHVLSFAKWDGAV